MHDFLDFYCERTGPEFWSEPLNALTNISFILAGVFVMRQCFRYKLWDAHMVLLCVLVLCIGVGSFLFHTFATRWAAIADVVPILLFQLVFLYAYSRTYIDWGRIRSIILPIGFVVASFLIGLLPSEWSNGSLSYGASVLFLFGVLIYHSINHKKGKKFLAAAACVFPISLTLRTIDEWICEYFPIGTHFLWHLLNGLVLFLLIQVVVSFKKQPERT